MLSLSSVRARNFVPLRKEASQEGFSLVGTLNFLDVNPFILQPVSFSKLLSEAPLLSCLSSIVMAHILTEILIGILLHLEGFYLSPISF